MISALIFGLIITTIIGFFALFGFEIFWKTVGRITKPLTPLFDYYLKLRIRKYTLYIIIEGFIGYILVMIPFVLFALLGAFILGI